MSHSLNKRKCDLFEIFVDVISFVVFSLWKIKGECPALADDAVEVEESTLDVNLGEEKQGSRTGLFTQIHSLFKVFIDFDSFASVLSCWFSIREQQQPHPQSVNVLLIFIVLNSNLISETLVLQFRCKCGETRRRSHQSRWIERGTN